jgi:hypothetical protein
VFLVHISTQIDNDPKNGKKHKTVSLVLKNDRYHLFRTNHISSNFFQKLFMRQKTKQIEIPVKCLTQNDEIIWSIDTCYF